MATFEILNALYDIEDAPWATLKGRPLDARRLASMLRPYGVKPKDVRINEKSLKGYCAEDLYDCWERYLPAPPDKSAISATSATEPEPAVEDDEYADVPF